MNLAEINPALLTFDETPNIGRVLERLTALPDIVVVDSGSTDGTLNIVAGFDNVRCYHRSFDTHARQWNYGVQQAETPWILSLDADYVLDPRFLDEVRSLKNEEDHAAYYAPFRYVVPRGTAEAVGASTPCGALPRGSLSI